MSIRRCTLGKNKLNGPASLPITASYPLPPTRNWFRPKKHSRLRKDGGQNCASLLWIAYILDRRQPTLAHQATFQIGRQFRFPWQPAENGWLEIGLYLSWDIYFHCKYTQKWKTLASTFLSHGHDEICKKIKPDADPPLLLAVTTPGVKANFRLRNDLWRSWLNRSKDRTRSLVRLRCSLPTLA